MKVSIVVCTFNRAVGLAQTLDCLRYQTYSNFEVVIVNGPSTDNTEDVLRLWDGIARIDRCAHPNLSMSRNIGIRAASGDIVAFIDDDALPEFDWLAQAVAAFDREEVAGVGGIVFDHTGMDLQYRFSAANRFGEAESRIDRPYDDLCVPGSFQFPYLQGTNALFRRSSLLRVGGFDETYDYYLDETDLCCRLIDAGFTLKQLDNAAVHHKFLPSNIRDHQRVVTNWYPIVKNHVYFSYRHALGAFSELDVIERSRAFIDHRLNDVRFHEGAGRLPVGSVMTAAERCAEAFSKGIRLGHERLDLALGPVTWPERTFLPFPTIDASNRRKLTLISSGYTPNLTGGISRLISDAAPALARRGNEVRVITKSNGPSAVDFEEGVWVHRIDPSAAGSDGVVGSGSAHVDDFTTAAVGEIERISGWSSHDVVYGPLWDVEILGAIRRTALPTAVFLVTPLAVAAEMSGFANDAAIRKLMECETAVLAEADLLHAISEAVIQTLLEHYGDAQFEDRWQLAPLGLRDCAALLLPDHAEVVYGPSKEIVVLFVGRFEKRKGIDVLLELLPNLLADYDNVRFIAAGEDRALAPDEELAGEAWLRIHSNQQWRGRVELLGAVSDETLHQLYASADLVVLPSRYESFGLVMVEAMMHGKALISCEVGGISEVVRNGIDGILVEPGDAVQLDAAVRSLLDDPTRRQELGREARNRFETSFDIERFAERFEKLLGRLSLRDASTALERPVAPMALVDRGEGGEVRSTLHAGNHIRFRVEPDSRSRLCLRVAVPSTVVVEDPLPKTLRLEPGRVHRIELSRGCSEVTCTVVEGTVIVSGIVEFLEVSQP